MGQSNEDFLKIIAQMHEMLNATNISVSPQDDGLDLSLVDDSGTPVTPVNKKFPITIENVQFMRKHVEGGKLKITEENAEHLLEKCSNIFEGIDLDLISTDDDDYFEES